MWRLGLSGGIGAGKSEAAEVFRTLGAPVLDADAIAKELTAPGSAKTAEIVEAFGREAVDDENRLNRARLRTIIFNDEAARRRLEAILHPEIRREIRRRTETLQDATYCVIVVPLLIETGMTDLVDRIAVLDCPMQYRIQRIIRRDGCNIDEARKIIRAQADAKEKLEAADVVIDNSGTLEQLKQQVTSLHRRWMQEAGG